MMTPSSSLLLLLVVVLFQLLFQLPQLHGLNADGSLLLSFKYAVLNDPLSVLGDWNYNDATPCAWNGVVCMGFPALASDAGVSNATTLSRVISLVLPKAQLLGSIPAELGLVEHLRHLDLSGNFLNGTLPATLFNASDLRVLSLADNEISGALLEFVGNMTSLQVLNLSDNALTGGIPSSLAMLPNLTVVSLSSNYLFGDLPGGAFDRLQVMDLSSNLVNGTLPAVLGGGSLRYLNLSYNRLTGDIPQDLGSRIPGNAIIDLSFNNFTGEIPDAGAFVSQKPRSFAGNSALCGKPLKYPCPIPSTLSNPPPNATAVPGSTSPPAFAVLPKNPNPDGNSTGAAVEGGGGGGGEAGGGGMRPVIVAAITVADLAGIGLLFIVFLYVYQAKKKKKQQQPQREAGLKVFEKRSREEWPSSSTTTVTTLGGGGGAVSAFPWCCRKNSNGGDGSEETSDTAASSETAEADYDEGKEDGSIKSRSSLQQKQQRAMLVMVDGEMELELETLLKASAYILGATGSSIVYKAVLADGTVLAVRRIGESTTIDKLKEFEAQVRSIARFRHPNLLRIRGFYWGADEKLLIYDYAPNGSLANISFSKKLGSSPFHLSWEARLRIARGVARGLAYLHEKKGVHGNVKPSNILLGADMEPIVADFGLERLMFGDGNKAGSSARYFGSKRSTSSLPELSPPPIIGASPSPCSSSAALSPMLPYHAPESLKSLKPNAKWDAYSFGIILLELIAGRTFPEAELCQWHAGFVVEERNRVLRMADPALRGEVDAKEEALMTCFKLAFSCASLAPQKRPSMKDALQILDKIPSSSNITSII